ncbi:putative aldouronate transport system substrate-binding protein [Evansella caseinilytica]|uniref:Putative aldouronate transport system substrate-binding protein n=1 Tax=Evansella caseinilytica TaxID=1503961 RepID=A0A1H3NXF3_9BACI|nr:extracellular solute-binding protein [Evansella caseinilytica]SDY93554.1 putative aldouronate transport system substrate-binding protein [Evansella caseinilytica]
MKKSSKLLSLLLSSFLAAAVLTACGEDTSSGGGNNESDNNDAQDQAGEMGEEPYTLTAMYNLHTPETPDDYLKELLEEATNTKLDIQWVPDGNYEERLNTAFATNTLPQVVPMGFNMFNQFKDAIRADQFWEIEPFLDEFENLRKLKPEVLDNTRVDGKLYSLYQGRPLSRQGLIYRKDWADNLGLEAPTTTEEVFEMARAFTEDDPNQSGKDDTIGLTDRNDLIYGAFKTIASWFGTPNYWGEKDGELLPEFMFDEYIETMDFVKELHESGYMNQDFPVTSKDDQQAMFKNGTAGMYIGSLPDVMSIYNDAKDLNPDVEYDVQNYIEGPDGEYGIWAIPGYASVVLFPKSAIATEDELRKVLAFYDKLMTAEVANLLIWGVEGEHYQVVDDGVETLEDNRQKIDTQVRPFLSMEIGEPETSGRYEMVATYEVKAKADALVIDNENYLIQDPTIVLDSDTYITHNDRLQQMIDDATYKYILRQIDLDGFNDVVEKWKNEGGNDIIAEFNDSYQSMK